MYGDTSAIRRLAQSMREQALDIGLEADRLVGQADNTHWTGLAAEAMRARARDRAAALRRSGGLHDDAAQALERHAEAVDRLKELIAAIERRVRSLLDAARGRLADLAHAFAEGLRDVLPDPADEWLDRFAAPAPGHRDWLGVDVPGQCR